MFCLKKILIQVYYIISSFMLGCVINIIPLTTCIEALYYCIINSLSALDLLGLCNVIWSFQHGDKTNKRARFIMHETSNSSYLTVENSKTPTSPTPHLSVPSTPLNHFGCDSNLKLKYADTSGVFSTFKTQENTISRFVLVNRIIYSSSYLRLQLYITLLNLIQHNI